MKILWNDSDRAAWDRLHHEALGAWQQDWAYGDAFRAVGGQAVRARVVSDGRTLALAQFTTRRFAGLCSIAACTRGPVWAPDADAVARREAIRLLKATAPMGRPRFLVFTPDEAAPAQGMERLSRLMTGYSTVMLDLDQEMDALRGAMHGKWRNRLAAAEKAGLQVQTSGVKPAQYQWLIERETEQRIAKGYKALPVGLVPAFQAGKPDRRDGLMVLTARLGKEAAAAMMFLIHGRAATYHIGWTGDAGDRKSVV